MRALIATIGSGGDVHPYIGIGQALAVRGHHVVLLANPVFEDRVRRAGLAFEACGTAEQYKAAIEHADLVHPDDGPAHVIRTLIAEPAREMFTRSRRIIRTERIDVVLRHMIAVGAGWGARHEGVLEAVGTLAPMFWMSTHDPSKFRKNMRARLPVWQAKIRRFVGRAIARWTFDPPINQARMDLGLPRMRNAFVNEIQGPGLNLGLWSRAFRAAAVDDPALGRICGFSWFDGADPAAPLDPVIERFLEAGPPPIIFTLGTSVVHHAGDFYGIARGACARVGRRAILLGAAESPSTSDTTALCVKYAPLTRLLTRGAVTVHHGGIGTTAQSLRSGRPMVIVPFANDEFDNAARAERLGVSVTLDALTLNPASLEAALRRALDDPTMLQASARFESLSQEDGAAAAAQELERFAANAPPKRSLVHSGSGSAGCSGC